MNTYKRNITVPKNWKDLSGLPERYPGYTPGCHLDGYFYCGFTTIISLEGAPSSVSGEFDCSNNWQLKSLKWTPDTVGGNFSCIMNALSSLEGAPSFIGGDFNCYDNDKMNSLTNIQKIIKEIKGKLLISSTIKYNMLGVILIKSLQRVDCDGEDIDIRGTPLQTAIKIFNKHLKKGRDVLECQEELIENGLKAYAKL